VGVVSLEDYKKASSDQLARTRADLLGTEALLSEARASFGLLTNTPVSASEIATQATNAVPPAKVTGYKNVLSRIDTLSKKEQTLLEQFTGESPFVRVVREQIAMAEAERQRLELESPGLTNLTAALARNPDRTTAADATSASAAALSRIRALEAKYQTLTAQLERIRTDALKVDEKEAEITQLERKKALDEKQYFYYSSTLEQARVDQALGPGKMANINVVQAASPASKDDSKGLKRMAMTVVGGLALGLGLALLFEFYVDQSVRRPAQVEHQLRLPLFLSIPRLHPPPAVGKGQLLLPGTAAEGSPAGATLSAVSLYSEALRDRLIMHFQLREVNHKPKLVGVTSCGHGAGVTTVAAGLAASLSEIGEGNVLYVDVNQALGPTVHPFRQGRPVVGISQAFDHETRGEAQVQENLYMVNLADPDGKRVGVLPRRLAGLVPQMKASDYDYIIFDLPPVTQTSATAKLAGLLDMTFVVLESEKTQTDLAKQATSLLTESRADVALILNKHHRYLPHRVDTDL
jgi:Mrp family chromosome partitioning ATPase